MRKQKSQFMYFYKNSDSPFLTLQNYLVLEKKKAGIDVIEKQKHRNRKIIIYTVIYVVVLISFTTYYELFTEYQTKNVWSNWIYAVTPHVNNYDIFFGFDIQMCIENKTR